MSPRSIRSSSRSLLALLAMALWLPAPSQAAGKPAVPKKDKAAEAQVRQIYGAAQKAYDLGRFEEALKGFSDAYALQDLPGFLFNIAQCHRNLGNYERSKFFYLRYLDLSPQRPKNAAQVEALLAKVEEKLAEETRLRQAEDRAAAQRSKEAAEQRKAEQAVAATTATTVASLPTARSLPPAAVPGASTAQPPPAAVAAGGQPDSVFTQWWFWTGVGVVAAGAGAATYVLTAPRPRETTLGNLGSL